MHGYAKDIANNEHDRTQHLTKRQRRELQWGEQQGGRGSCKRLHHQHVARLRSRGVLVDERLSCRCRKCGQPSRCAKGTALTSVLARRSATGLEVDGVACMSARCGEEEDKKENRDPYMYNAAPRARACWVCISTDRRCARPRTRSKELTGTRASGFAVLLARSPAAGNALVLLRTTARITS